MTKWQKWIEVKRGNFEESCENNSGKCWFLNASRQQQHFSCFEWDSCSDSAITPSTIIIICIPLWHFFFIFFNFPFLNSVSDFQGLLALFFLSEGKPVGKRGAAHGNVTFGRATHTHWRRSISSLMDFVLLQWNIWLCHSQSRAWPLRSCVIVLLSSLLIFLPFFFLLCFCLCVNKSQIVALFTSPRSIVSAWEPGTAGLLMIGQHSTSSLIWSVVHVVHTSPDGAVCPLFGGKNNFNIG